MWPRPFPVLPTWHCKRVCAWKLPRNDPTAPVICVDGPSGAGKGTLSQRLAAELGWHLLDSGALYRVVGFACRQQAVALEDSEAVAGMWRAP